MNNWSRPSDDLRSSPLRLRCRSALFATADLAFLMGVGATTNIAMLLVHSSRWNCVASVVIGMAAAMAVQMALATLAAPILGSIETMVPSMVVGMIGPMQICIWESVGGAFTYKSAALCGIAFGLFVFAGLSWWARTHQPLCREHRTR